MCSAKLCRKMCLYNNKSNNNNNNNNNNNMLNKSLGLHIYWDRYVLAVFSDVKSDKNERLGGLSLESIDSTTLFTSQSIRTARGLNSVTNHFSCCAFFRRHFCTLNHIQQVFLPVRCSCCTLFSCLDSKYILRIKGHYEGPPEELKGKESTPMQCTRGGQMTSFSIEEEWGLL
jgi:hypothetical protein